MKRLIITCFLLLPGIAMQSCTDKKKKEETEMIPVEPDNGIGDGAPSLDSLLTKPKDSLTQE